MTCTADSERRRTTPASGARRATAAIEYGDAADVAIDANGDGRVTLTDELLVARAVDQVELEHPDLVGGLGLYTSGRLPYAVRPHRHARQAIALEGLTSAGRAR